MQKAGYSVGLVQVFNNLGLACAQQQKWALAEDFFSRSIALCRQLDMPVDQARAEDNLGEAYLGQRKWKSALEVLTQARERLGSLKREGEVASQLHDIEKHLKAAEFGLLPGPTSI